MLTDGRIGPEVDDLLDITNIAFVFSPFSCNLVIVIEELTSETHSCIGRLDTNLTVKSVTR